MENTIIHFTEEKKQKKSIGSVYKRAQSEEKKIKTTTATTIIILYVFCYCSIISPFRFVSLIKIIWLIRSSGAIDCTTSHAHGFRCFSIGMRFGIANSEFSKQRHYQLRSLTNKKSYCNRVCFVWLFLTYLALKFFHLQMSVRWIDG